MPVEWENACPVCLYNIRVVQKWEGVLVAGAVDHSVHVVYSSAIGQDGSVGGLQAGEHGHGGDGGVGEGGMVEDGVLSFPVQGAPQELCVGVFQLTGGVYGCVGVHI